MSRRHRSDYSLSRGQAMPPTFVNNQRILTDLGRLYWHHVDFRDEEVAKAILMYCHAQRDPQYLQTLGSVGVVFHNVSYGSRQQQINNARQTLREAGLQHLLEILPDAEPIASASMNNHAQLPNDGNRDLQQPPVWQPPAQQQVPPTHVHAGPTSALQQLLPPTPLMSYGATPQLYGPPPAGMFGFNPMPTDQWAHHNPGMPPRGWPY